MRGASGRRLKGSSGVLEGIELGCLRGLSGALKGLEWGGRVM